MSLSPMTYHATCDVQGCNNDELGTLIELNRSGWSHRTVESGKISRTQLAQYAPGSCLCPDCSYMGFEKEMKVAGTT